MTLEYLKGVLKTSEEVMYDKGTKNRERMRKRREKREKEEQVQSTVIGSVRQRLVSNGREFRRIILVSVPGPHYQE